MTDSMFLVLGATENAAKEIREQLADALRRLEMINFTLAAARTSMAIDALDEQSTQLANAEPRDEFAWSIDATGST